MKSVRNELDEKGPGILVTLTVLVISSLTIMANATIAPSLPGLAVYFRGIPQIETLQGLIVSLPSLAIILTATFFGLMAERFGRKPILMVSLLLYAIGGSTGLFVNDMTSLLIGRVVLGVGVSGTMTVATMLAADLWTGQARVKFMGKQAAIMNLGGVVFLLLGGLLAEYSWRGSFGIYLLAIPVMILVWYGIKEEPKKKNEVKKPKIPLDWPICLKIGLLGFFTMVVFYLIPIELPFLLKTIGIDSTTISGLAIGSVTLASVVTAMNFQRIRNYLNPVAIYAVSFFLMAIGYFTISNAVVLPQIFLGGMFVGFGLGGIMPNQNNWLMESIHPETRGRAAGILTSFVFTGQFASPLISGAIKAVTPIAIFSSFAIGLCIMTVFMLPTAIKKPQLKGVEDTL
ncbi:MFS transporter [Aquimarina algiphila]|uniref:MFS transporter n=1 Tax=Aquimarina algiphila TaxID=2047982 RepID=UPI00248FB514|nr:MFS transporter [Aquimarina algiphila]